ncbi:hypothetical protein PGT21_037184 [Puccinia graminis f. sp. tritici]|uniref:Uncharacterized protein n=1 Tax=Puccinia graminis f. sp. tritici TaxID=56615 RepID=A0A5B0R3Z3_PUCGR|nr:hypothetical protein PGT21_037184 [Puccinia graminis f. sp. tritici]
MVELETGVAMVLVTSARVNLGWLARDRCSCIKSRSLLNRGRPLFSAVSTVPRVRARETIEETVRYTLKRYRCIASVKRCIASVSHRLCDAIPMRCIA